MDSNFSHCIKNCSVVLKRLNEKLVKEYLEKYNADTGTQTWGIDNNKFSERTNVFEGSTVTTRRRSQRIIKLLSSSCSLSNEENCTNDNFKVPNIDLCVPRKSTSGKRSEGKKEIMKPCEISLEKGQKTSESPEDNSDCEIQIIKELLKPAREPLIACRESSQVQKLVEDESDKREDGEDDKNTVIFEEELSKERHSEEAFQENNIMSKKLKNREITNRKKQWLVKFKKKRMNKSNSMNFRKHKSKILESGQDSGEKSKDCVSEETLHEVCTSVKHLHESYRIIQQLQRELPKDTELAVHFAKVIQVQQENFHKELKESQKIIMKCYDKMLNVYNDTKKVASEISKRTYLSVEDVVSIISRYILIEGHCESDKTTNTPTVKSQRGTVFVRSPNSINRTQMITTTTGVEVTMSEYPTARSLPCVTQPVEYVRRPIRGLAWEPEVSESDTLKKQKVQNCEANSTSQQGFMQTGLTSGIVVQQVLPNANLLGSNTIQQCTRVQAPQVQPANLVAVPSVLRTIYPPPVYLYNKPNNTNRLEPNNKNCYPLATSNVMNGQMQTTNTGVCLVNFIPTNPVRLRKQPGGIQKPVQMPLTIQSTETRSENSENGVLDPTIPQKLTMRDCRLQAGPILIVQNGNENGGERANGMESSGQNNPESRVYICAQPNCKNPGVKICSYCKSVIYCSGTCQRKHWTVKHKIECSQLKSLRA